MKYYKCYYNGKYCGLSNILVESDDSNYVCEEISEQEYNRITQEENDKNRIIQEAYDNLAATDYIIIKMYEAQVENDLTLLEQLKIKYAEQLNQRKIWRQQIDQ